MKAAKVAAASEAAADERRKLATMTDEELEEHERAAKMEKEHEQLKLRKSCRPSV